MRYYKQVPTRFGEMCLFLDDPSIGKSLDLYGEYCYPEIELILNMVNSDSIVLDVGANIGSHCLALAPYVNNIVAFEADKENADLLEINCGLQSADNISVKHLALGNSVGLTGTKFDFGKTCLSTVTDPDVEITTLDTWMTLHELMLLPKVDFIKIDVEGMELAVLKGGKSLITTVKPSMLIEMQDELKNPAVYDFLIEAGYKIWWYPVATFNAGNYNNNQFDVFGRQHGVINWFASQHSHPITQELMPVVDRFDTIERAEHTRRN